MVELPQYDFYLGQANYDRHDDVEDVDYVDVHYFRFRRGEKQLAN